MSNLDSRPVDVGMNDSLPALRPVDGAGGTSRTTDREVETVDWLPALRPVDGGGGISRTTDREVEMVDSIPARRPDGSAPRVVTKRRGSTPVRASRFDPRSEMTPSQS